MSDVTTISSNRAGTSRKALSVVPLHTTALGAPIFLIHWNEKDLGAWIGKNRPLYGLAYGLATDSPERPAMPDSSEKLAAHYVEQMKTVQPQGPYHIVGHSSDGIVVYEMIVRLAESNDLIGFVELLDSDIPSLALPRKRISQRQVMTRIGKTPGSNKEDALSKTFKNMAFGSYLH
jgi:thioesterase domain-containing protein